MRTYSGEKPVVNLPKSIIKRNEGEFREAIRKLFQVYRACVNVKTKSQIRSERKELKNRLSSLTEKKESKEEAINRLENRISADPPEEMKNALRHRKREKEDQLDKVVAEIEEIETKLEE